MFYSIKFLMNESAVVFTLAMFSQYTKYMLKVAEKKRFKVQTSQQSTRRTSAVFKFVKLLPAFVVANT